MYDNWEAVEDQKAADMQEGWDAMQAALAEDEAYAQFLFESFHGSEY